MSRDYAPHPRIGVGIVAFREHSVLLIKRGNPPRQGEWSLPGGAQELGETVARTAVREMHEETGLEIEAGPVVAVVDMIDRDESGVIRLHYTLIDVLATSVKGDLRAGDDALEAAWIPLADLPTLGLWQETLNVIAKALSLRDA